jgi:acetyltransferase-like isoleucine patch superfamily enzyme
VSAYINTVRNYKLYNHFVFIIKIIKDFLYEFILNFTIRYEQKLWRENNKENFTSIANGIHDNKFPLDKVHAGKYSYGKLLVYSYSDNDAQLFIGNLCSIAEGVKFMLGGEHNYKCLLTYPIHANFSSGIDSNNKGNINIEDDVWIGANSIILSGVTLARGTVVAAGSVVIKSTLPYSIVGGNPAKLIKFRFDAEIIKKISKIDLKKIDKYFVIKNSELLSKEITIESINAIIFILSIK